jgi:hypothetical protein
MAKRFTGMKTDTMTPQELAELDHELRRQRDALEQSPPFRYRISVEWSDDERLYVASIGTLGSPPGKAFSPADAVETALRHAEEHLADLQKKKKRVPKPDVAAS